MVRLAFTWLTCGECTERFTGPRGFGNLKSSPLKRAELFVMA